MMPGKKRYFSKAASCYYSWAIDSMEFGQRKSCGYNGCICKFRGSCVNRYVTVNPIDDRATSN